jgi:hypothetical protein
VIGVNLRLRSTRRRKRCRWTADTASHCFGRLRYKRISSVARRSHCEEQKYPVAFQWNIALEYSCAGLADSTKLMSKGSVGVGAARSFLTLLLASLGWLQPGPHVSHAAYGQES